MRRRAGDSHIGGLIGLILFAALLVVFARCSQSADESPDALLQELEAAKRPGCVFDFAGVMRTEDVEATDAMLRQFELDTGNEVKLVTVRSLRGAEIDDFANKLFERWGIGKKGQDNGVLLLAAIEDRRVRIEVGYGLEPVLTDARAGRILDEHVLPTFRAGNYSAGLRAGARAIANLLGGKGDSGADDISAKPQPGAATDGQQILVSLLVLVLMLVVLIRHPWLLLFMGARSGGTYRSGFGGGGFCGGGFGGGGFGGGLSGGGGASRGW